VTTPITGPFTRTMTLKGPPNSFGAKPDHLTIYRQWYRQKKPYNLPLPYDMGISRIWNYESNDPVTVKEISTGISADFDLTPLGEEAYNRAYAKFTEQVHGEQAQLAVSWLERQKTLDMMAKRLIQTRKLVRALRHFEWDEAAKLVGFNRSKGRVVTPPEWRTSANKSGGAFLEFHFGWAPTIKEVMRCVDLLSGDWPKPRIRSRAAVTGFHRTFTGSGFSAKSVEFHTSCKRGLQAEIKVSDPNLLLADQMGLVNPLTTVNEVIPYSFLVDWVANLSDYLESFYPFTGVTLVNPVRVNYNISRQFHFYFQHPSRERWWSEQVGVTRITGSFPGPTLRLRRLKPLSVTRAATAASFLLQQVRRGKAPW